MENSIVYKVVDYRRKSMFAHGKYSLVYRQDTVVEMISNSVGIMCCDTIENTKRFLAEGCKVLRVKGIEQ